MVSSSSLKGQLLRPSWHLFHLAFEQGEAPVWTMAERWRSLDTGMCEPTYNHNVVTVTESEISDRQ